MAYTTNQALKALDNYMNLADNDKEIIPDTKNRGLLITTRDFEKIVLFVYPLVHKQDNTKNYFDTRDSGVKERFIAWNYAKQNGMKYYCLGLNDSVDKYVDYVFSLECEEDEIEKISGTKDGERNGPGNQIIIPNDYIPSKPYERIQNRLGVFISVVHKDSLSKYLTFFDNRPYMQEGYQTENSENAERSKFAKNRIIFGAPGTGKSYTLNKEARLLLGDSNTDSYERVTFHPDYLYANFVGTYKPVMVRNTDGSRDIAYEYVPGPFMRVYVNAIRSARSDNPKPQLLVIEEINRANVAAVFGEIFQLLDRDDNGVSEYPIQASEDIKFYLADQLGGEPEDYNRMRIPHNMFIWATMNSADQGVFPMDTAFKRRWDFTYLGINDSDEDICGKHVIVGDEKGQKVEWNKLRKAINNFLANEKINEDKQLGPYFIARNIVVPENGDEIDREKFAHVFKNKVIMYLFEDAAKQKRSKLFQGCFSNSTRYSEICREFDQKGIGIFNEDIILESQAVDLNGNNPNATDEVSDDEDMLEQTK